MFQRNASYKPLKAHFSCKKRESWNERKVGYDERELGACTFNGEGY
jgi:hypothetical protein